MVKTKRVKKAEELKTAAAAADLNLTSHRITKPTRSNHFSGSSQRKKTFHFLKPALKQKCGQLASGLSHAPIRCCCYMTRTIVRLRYSTCAARVKI